MICIFLIEDKYKKEKMPGLLPKYTCKVSRIIIFPLKHIKHKIIILTHVYEKTEVWTLRGTTRPHFLFQSWYPFPTENSTGVQCLRTSGKFGCAWACKEVFLLSVFSRISKQTLERTISVELSTESAENLEKLRLCSSPSLVLLLICKIEPN